LRRLAARGEAVIVADTVIFRDEVGAQLFNVSDIATSLESIEALLGGGDDAEEESDGS
jgi:hypothetical protein